MYTGNNFNNLDKGRLIDVAGKATKFSNLTSLPSFLEAHHPYIALHFFRVHKHNIHICMDTDTNHFTPLMPHVQGKNIHAIFKRKNLGTPSFSL